MKTPTNIKEIRDYFGEQYKQENFTVDRNGNKTIELLGASFVADEEFIFRRPNKEYIKAELEWYYSMSTNINDIYDGEKEPPQAWKVTANKHGEINSNYGYLIFSEENGNQFGNVLNELIRNPDSRRASMIYNRPTIWNDYRSNGKNDFICTNSVAYYIRDNKMHAVVQMRSNDSIFGFLNDRWWAKEVLNRLCIEYNDFTAHEVKPGNIHWQVQNLHVYDRHFYLLDHYNKTGETTITLKEYEKLYK